MVNYNLIEHAVGSRKGKTSIRWLSTILQYLKCFSNEILQSCTWSPRFILSALTKHSFTHCIYIMPSPSTCVGCLWWVDLEINPIVRQAHLCIDLILSARAFPANLIWTLHIACINPSGSPERRLILCCYNQQLLLQKFINSEFMIS